MNADKLPYLFKIVYVMSLEMNDELLNITFKIQ